jgi:Na+/H+ antiporter NhaD/arsenite permease-like protein
MRHRPPAPKERSVSPELISILVLAAMFVIATVLPINIGVLAFVAAFVVGGTLAGMDGETVLEGFPGELTVTLIGITYLFAMAQNNGTIDWLVRVAVAVVRGRLVAIPWVMFAVAGLLTAFGAVSPAAVAIIAPVALGFAYQFRINPLLMGIMVVHGAQAGGFSPISIYGTITNSVVERAELPGSPITLFLASLFFNLGIAVVGFVLFGGIGLIRRRTDPSDWEEPRPAGDPAERADGATSSAGTTTMTETGTSVRPTTYQLVTLIGLVGLGIATLVYELDVGLVALTVALVLVLISPESQKSAISQISWPVVLLIAGVLTYVAVLEELGTIDYASESVAGVGSAYLAALLLCYVGAIVSAFASSTALLGAIIPLAVPFLQTGELGAVGVIAALAVSSTVVDVSPFSTNGAIVLANAHEEDRDRVYKQLLGFGAAVVAVAPLVAWSVLVVPGWL